MQEKSAITRTIETAPGVYAPGHLGELTQIVDFALVDAVLQETRSREKRLRLLPARVARLALVKGVPLLRIVRTAAGPDGTVLEVNDTRMSAEEFEIGYSIIRHPSAELD